MPVSNIVSRIGQIESKIQSYSGINQRQKNRANNNDDTSFSNAMDKSVEQLGKATSVAAPTAEQILEALQAGPVAQSAFAGQESPNLAAIKAMLQGGSTNPALFQANNGLAGVNPLSPASQGGAITNLSIPQTQSLIAAGHIPSALEDMPISTNLGQAIVHLASRHIGKNYVYGGQSDAQGGFDCSGLVLDALKRAGIKMPRSAKDQAKVGQHIPSLDQAIPGDLLTFGDPAHHIGIYVGNNKMLDAPSRGKQIRIKDLGNRKITDIRRVRPATTSLADVAYANAVKKNGGNPLIPGIPTTPTAITQVASGSTVKAPGLDGTNPSGRSIPPENATSQKLRALLQKAAQKSGDPEYMAVTNVNDVVRNVPYADLFNQAGRKYGFSPRFLAAIARTESNFNPKVVSHAGAVGVMQLMPVTAREVGVDPANRTDVVANIDGASHYIAKYFAKQPNVSMGLAAYNAGPGAVRRHGGVPPYKETQNYVVRVRKYMKDIS